MCLTNFACWINDTKFETWKDSEDLFSTRVFKQGSNSDLHIYTPAHWDATDTWPRLRMRKELGTVTSTMYTHLWKHEQC